MLKCRYTRARIPAFINQELPINARRYVARHLDECAACRAQFEAQKSLRYTLMAEMPRLGQPATTTLENVWARVSADLKAPAEPKPSFLPTLRTAAYGFVAALMGLAMLMPLASHLAPAEALQIRPARPVPAVKTDTTSEAALTAAAHATQIAFVLDYEPAADVYNTPELAQPATPEAAQAVQGTPEPHIQKS